MKTKTKKTAYYHNATQERVHIARATRKITAFKSILDTIGAFLTNVDNKALANNTSEYIEASIRNKYSENLPIVDYAKLCELIGLDIDNLNKLIKVFNKLPGDVNWDKLQPTKKDFHEYAIGTEEHERLKLADEAVRVFDSLAKVTTVRSYAYSQGCHSVLIVDHNNPTKVRINPAFITGKAHIY